MELMLVIDLIAGVAKRSRFSKKGKRPLSSSVVLAGFEFFYNGKLSFNSQFSSVDKTKLLSHFPTEKEPQFRKKPSSFLI